MRTARRPPLGIFQLTDARKASRRMKNGFTLVELAIVVTVVALITALVLTTTSITQKGGAQEITGIAKDLIEATKNFKARFGYLPGDLPNAQAQLPNLVAACNFALPPANPNIGNGLIDQAAEIACAIDMLQAANMIRADPDPANPGRFILRSSMGNIRLIASIQSAAGGGLPVTSNLVEFAQLRCAIAMSIDAKLDEGVLNTGQIQASVAACVPNGANDPVPLFAMRLN
jgi:prepilin-type N-terminal cleavage/methylation domain-containing protein